MVTKIFRLLRINKTSYGRKGLLDTFLGYFLYLIRSIIVRGQKALQGFYKQTYFTFQGNNYTYWHHHYNNTWINERAIEIPIVLKILQTNKGKNILEIGNVLSHYYSVEHDIVDKYEKAKGIINQDIIDFQPLKKYSLIVSISTLEHIGWDETPRNPEKIIRVFDNLTRMLAPRGKIVATIPLGYNPVIEKQIKSGILRFEKLFYLKKISYHNRWIEVKSFSDTEGTKYNRVLLTANALIIAVFENHSEI